MSLLRWDDQLLRGRLEIGDDPKLSLLVAGGFGG